MPIKPIIADTLKKVVGVLHTHPDLIPFVKTDGQTNGHYL